MKTNAANRIIAWAIFAALAAPLAASARPPPSGPSARRPHEIRCYEPQRRSPQFHDHHYRPQPHRQPAMRVHWAPPPPPVYYGGWYYSPPPPPPPPPVFYYPCNPGFSIQLRF